MRNIQLNQKLKSALTEERLKKYLDRTDGNLDQALALYERNTALSEAFYTPLQHFEICLRNSMSVQMAVRYGSDWLTNNKPPFYADTADWISETIQDLKDQRKNHDPGDIIAELRFAFWLQLLAARYDNTLWRQALYKAFQGATGQRRSVVYGRVNMIRRFRNRVAHHEPIFHKELDMVHQEIIEAIEWICRDTSKWAASQSRYHEIR